MCPDKKRPAENTCRIVKGLDAVWAHFCPSKPCLPLSIDGSVKGNRQGSLSPTEARRFGMPLRAGSYMEDTGITRIL